MLLHQRRQNASGNHHPCPFSVAWDKQIFHLIHNLPLRTVAHIGFYMHKSLNVCTTHWELWNKNCRILAHPVHWLLGQQMQPCLMHSTLHGNIDAPGFFPFVTLPVILNCCTHCRMISQERSISPSFIMSFLWTLVMILFLPPPTHTPSVVCKPF